MTTLSSGTPTEGRAIGEPMADEASAGFGPDGRAFLTLGKEGTVKLRDASTGTILTTLLTSASLGHLRGVSRRWRPDRRRVSRTARSGSATRPLRSRSVRRGHMRHAVQHIVFTSDGRTVVAIDEEGESRTWPVPEPLPDSSVDDLTLRIEARTGLA